MTGVPAVAIPTSKISLVQEWIGKAHDDLCVAFREHSLGSGGSTDAVTYHCQQAIEKLLKGLIVATGVEPPYIHDLVRLSRDVSQIHSAWAWDIDELRFLTFGGVAARYPGSQASQQDAAHAYELAIRIWTALVSFY